ncbi:MBG domain-containing protein [Adlercreutzia caecimuris]|uniref:MBG domain-containing protein n=1 Tax=Adlercreutzia caecimuris TaxID=671266 RepID=UPI002494330D|nr:MBG domain-containing protein [Adlercreutzia caecimuris]
MTVSAPADAKVSFSTDNVYRDVTDGAVEVEYTVTRPNYRTITGTAPVQITPRPVTITVNDASKFAGAADPALTGSVEGLVAGDSLDADACSCSGCSDPNGSHACGTDPDAGRRRADAGNCHAYGGHAGSGGYPRGNDARERSRGYRGRRHPAGRRARRAHAVG